jgi:hypothetical protein
MPAIWVDRSSSRGEAAKYKDFQYFIFYLVRMRMNNHHSLSVGFTYWLVVLVAAVA